MKAWLEAHPIGGFAFLAFGISYLVGGPVLFALASAIPAHREPLHTYAPRVFVVLGPGLAALVLARLARRDGGAAGLASRLIPSWADIACGGAVVVTCTAASAGALLAAGVRLPEILQAVSANPGLLLAHAAWQVGLVATGEELGWRGWLLPRLAERTSRLRATLATAALWGAWHAPLLFAGAREAAMFLLMVLGLSALLTALWSQRGGRLFVVVVAHAAVNTPLFFWEQVGTFPHGDAASLRTAWYLLEAFYAAVGLALVVGRWRWWTGGGPAFE